MSSFLFLVQEEQSTSSESAVFRAGATMETRVFKQLETAGALYLRPEEALARAASPGRVARNLGTLLKLIGTLRPEQGLERLVSQLLDLVFAAIPASEGAVVLIEGDSAEPAWIHGQGRDGELGRPVEIDDEVVRRVLSERIAMLGSAGAGGGPILAAPVAGHERTAGALYLSAADPRIEFDEDHLQLVTAIGAVAGMVLEDALHMERLESENRRLREEIAIEHDMIGESPPMQEVYRFIAKAAPAAANVLITGESGTGKELLARAIHANSRRAKGPFVAVNCAALTETLLESELFGHEKGAFTGAIVQKKGKFEAADGGTIFLDEIGELPGGVQAKLLRVLQEREFDRVGGIRPVKVDVRVIAATNRELRKEIESGRFRDDLYYRLNVVSCRMPALRERRDDIPLLAAFFTERHAARMGRRVSGISRAARACLGNYDWPGNVRELDNAIERAVVLGSGDQILPEDLPEDVLACGSPRGEDVEGFHRAVLEEKRRVILGALRKAGGNHTEAARRLGVNPTYLSRLIRNLDLKDEIRRIERA